MENSEDKNVPMDGLSYYMEQNWDAIRSNKELNLPDQRKLVAEFRCNEVKDCAIEELTPLVQQLEKDSNVEYMEDFKTRADVIISKAKESYAAETH